MKTGVINGEIGEDTHAVSEVYENSPTWCALVRFLKGLPKTKIGTT